jgi:hypothetical protein
MVDSAQGIPALISPRRWAANSEGGHPGNTLENLIATPLPDGCMCWVVSQQALYAFEKDNSNPVAFPEVVAAGGGGRWVQISYSLEPGDTLVNGAFREVLPTGDPFYTSATWYTSPAKVQKILEEIVVRDPTGLPSTITTLYYDIYGNLVLTVIDAITYSNLVESTRNRTVV